MDENPLTNKEVFQIAIKVVIAEILTSIFIRFIPLAKYDADISGVNDYKEGSLGFLFILGALCFGGPFTGLSILGFPLVILGAFFGRYTGKKKIAVYIGAIIGSLPTIIFVLYNFNSWMAGIH